MIGHLRPVPPAAVGSAEKQNKYQDQQKRKRHKASNLVCRLLLEKKNALGSPARAGGPPRHRATSRGVSLPDTSRASDRNDSTPRYGRRLLRCGISTRLP